MSTQAQIAAHLDLSARTVARLVAEGVLPEAERRAGLDLDACRLAYVRHLREIAAGRVGNGEGDHDLVTERARLAKEQADKTALENRVRRNELAEVADVNAAVQAAFARVRSRLLAVPGKVAPRVVQTDDPAEAELDVRGAITEALRELSQTDVSKLENNDER